MDLSSWEVWVWALDGRVRLHLVVGEENALRFMERQRETSARILAVMKRAGDQAA